jgi:hypothetical protein
MQIKIDLQKRTYFQTAVWAKSMYAPIRSHKETVKRHITTSAKFFRVSSTHADAYLSMDNKTVRVFSLEKRRKKVEVVTDKKLLKKGIKRQIVSPSHWVATYYDIPVELLRLANLRVVQSSRTWHFVKLK